MWTIGKSTDYAARILLHLASLPEGSNVRSGEIVEKRLIPATLVRRIVSRLSSAGLLETRRGVGGGIRLARPAKDITLLDLVEATDGPVVLNCCLDEPETCPLSAGCPVRTTWGVLSHAFSSLLARVTFADLALGKEQPVPSLPVLGGLSWKPDIDGLGASRSCRFHKQRLDSEEA